MAMIAGVVLMSAFPAMQEAEVTPVLLLLPQNKTSDSVLKRSPSTHESPQPF